MQIVHDYRTLHTIPELDRELPKTLSYIQKQLSPLHCKVFSPIRGSVCAFFDFGKPDCIAFRADIDALPITELTQLPWRSCHPGKMHACGHDGHTAILLALARKLHCAETLPHNVLLIFQPAEETDGGEQLTMNTEETAADFENDQPKDYEAPVDSEETDVIFEHGAEPTADLEEGDNA